MISKKSAGILAAILLLSCSSGTPLKRLQSAMSEYPEFSIMLADMKEEGNFFKDYYHRYKVVFGHKVAGQDSLTYERAVTDWYRVDRSEFQKYENFLGMVLVSKGPDGKISDDRYPPGYQYVGDSRYGEWRRDSGGNSFWSFYGKYAFFRSMFGMFGGPIYSSRWDTYRDARYRGRPYYGSNHEYGTGGSYTKRTSPGFYQRRQQRELSRKARFSDRVRQRARRSRMSGFRRRSGGFGK